MSKGRPAAIAVLIALLVASDSRAFRLRSGPHLAGLRPRLGRGLRTFRFRRDFERCPPTGNLAVRQGAEGRKLAASVEQK